MGLQLREGHGLLPWATLIKTTFPVPAPDREISSAFPVSAARTVARERHGEFLAGTTCLLSSSVATEVVGNGQDRGAGEEGKSPSIPKKSVQPSHKSVSCHYSTPQLPYKSLRGMSERRKTPSLPMFASDGRGTWENVERGKMCHGHEVWGGQRQAFSSQGKENIFLVLSCAEPGTGLLVDPFHFGKFCDSKTE